MEPWINPEQYVCEFCKWPLLSFFFFFLHFQLQKAINVLSHAIGAINHILTFTYDCVLWFQQYCQILPIKELRLSDWTRNLTEWRPEPTNVITRNAFSPKHAEPNLLSLFFANVTFLDKAFMKLPTKLIKRQFIANCGTSHCHAEAQSHTLPNRPRSTLGLHYHSTQSKVTWVRCLTMGWVRCLTRASAPLLQPSEAFISLD